MEVRARARTLRSCAHITQLHAPKLLPPRTFAQKMCAHMRAVVRTLRIEAARICAHVHNLRASA